MRRVCGQEIDLGRARDMIAFALICGLAVPIVTGVVAATIHTAMRGGVLVANIGVWSLGDILGLLTITPACWPWCACATTCANACCRSPASSACCCCWW